MDILSSLLSQNVSTQTDKQGDFERVYWFSEVLIWMQRPRSSEEKSLKKETIYSSRLKYLLFHLNKNPEWKNNFILTVSALIQKFSSPTQLTSAGLPYGTSFLQDFLERLQEKIIPKTPLSEDLSTLIFEIFPNEDESLYIDFIDEDILKEFFNFFHQNKQLTEQLIRNIKKSCYLLSHLIFQQSLQIQKELGLPVDQPELLIEFKLEGLLRNELSNEDLTIPEESLQYAYVIEKNLDEFYLKMKEAGVKIDLVYLFQNQRRILSRLQNLIKFLIVNISKEANFRYFVSHLVLEVQHQKSLKSFFSENLTLLTERIVQTNTQIGEHYVTFDLEQFKKMFHAAVGGGAITSITVYIKFFLTHLNFLGFIKGLADSLNYSGSFLLIQFFGWTLATKQPSTTAPFIASALKKSITEARKAIIALLRTQFISVMGNLSMVFPVCFLVSWASFKLNHSVMDEQHALDVFNSTRLLGPSILFASFTGCLLFLGSLFAAWFENWMVVNRIDKRIRYNDKLQKYFGMKRVFKFSEIISEKSNALAANISLGFLLGMTPQIMKFFGIPLEVRHITLATGAFAASLPMALQSGVDSWQIVNALSGILLIGLANISVSFALAFLLASISSKVKFSSLWRLLKWGLRLIITRPWLLFVPEKPKAQVRIAPHGESRSDSNKE